MSEHMPGPAASALSPVVTGQVLQMAALAIAACAAAYARTAVSPLQETMRSALGLSDNHMALLQGPALALPLVVAAVPLGLLIDRYSRIRLLLILAVLNAAGTLLTAMTTTFSALFAARCLVGLTAFAVNPVVLSLIGDLFVPAQRGRATMAMAIGQFAGMSAAFALGGILLALVGSAPDSWRWAMAGLGVPLALVIALMFVVREPPRTQVTTRNPSTRRALREMWHYRAMIAPLLIGVLAVEVGIGAVVVWAAPVLARGFALAPDRIGVVMAVGLAVSGVLGPILGGTLADLCHRTGGPRRTMCLLAGLASASAACGVFGIIHSALFASVLLVLFMTLIMAMVVMGTTLFTVVIPGELRGLCVAMLAGACVLFGTGLAPLTVSILSGAIGGPDMVGQALAVVCVAGGLCAAVAFVAGRRHFPGAV